MIENYKPSQAWLAAFLEISEGVPFRVRVNGHCMAPLVHDGARVQVSRPAHYYWPGDVVVLPIDGRGMALHRVIGVYRRGGRWKYLTQGDSATRPDTAVLSSQILGRVQSGDCSPLLIQVPFSHRLRAFAQFLQFVINRFLRNRYA